MIAFELTDERRVAIEKLYRKGCSAFYIAEKISRIYGTPCDPEIIVSELFRIEIDGVDSELNKEIPHPAPYTVTPGSGTDRPVLPDAQKDLQGLGGENLIGFKAPEAASVPVVAETLPPARSVRTCAHPPCGKEFTRTSKNQNQIYCSTRCNKAASRDRARVKAEAEKATAAQEASTIIVPVSEPAKSQPEPVSAFVWTDEIVAEMMRLKQDNYSNGNIAFWLNKKFCTALTPNQIAGKLFRLKPAKMRAKPLNAETDKPENASPIEPSPLDDPLKLIVTADSFVAKESQDVAAPRMPEPPQTPPRLIGRIVLPIPGDPPPGRSEYDKMLRGEK